MPEQEIPRISMTPEEIEAANVGSATKLNGQVVLCEPDPRWAVAFETEAARMREELDSLDHRIEHVGSTSVPDLPAKPVVDMLLIVPDSSDEASYLPALEPLGYTLVIREPEWYEHRVLRKQFPDDRDHTAESVNLHVLSTGCPENERMLRFRDRLRTHDGDRTLYSDTKRALSRQDWEYIQNYADAKSEVVAGILGRAMADAD
ncbi:GrpB family protein [Streptomyces sp. NPDC058374]|uniref:GrpB family protein n=1 Tax=Streptomyces sp. NPDC058374 TaxID=3346466 RepID=UPI003646C80A